MEKTMKNTLSFIVLISTSFFLAGCGIQSIPQAKNATEAASAEVTNQYKRRADLIPNIVKTVAGYAKQEKEVFGALAEARTRYAGASTQADKVSATNGVESALSRLLVVMENYPQLKSSDTVRDLMTQLEGTENRVAVERQKYNDQIKGYNLRVQRVPGSILAGIFGFDVASYFEATSGSEKAPEVKF